MKLRESIFSSFRFSYL